MSLRIQHRLVDGIAVLDLEGDLVLGSATAHLQDYLAASLENGRDQAVLNFRSAPRIDSAGLGVLVSAHSKFSDAKGALKLLHLSQRHLNLLILTRLSTIFELFDDEKSAVDSFFADRASRPFDILQWVQSQKDTALHLGAESETANDPEGDTQTKQKA